ncbi:peptide deformylase [Xenorhabdus eapokensis]|uniref:Peptide deformylase n=1 Tax=Xenorhabdus eapokensis TaxID=1873482 RepID=A0A1Q5TS72_9GAMM|nr:peptide deformylase [Xenorhabdus eapokensis]OKP04150.1 peptide deformylase [Xenorhabdus eapokensis]
MSIPGYYADIERFEKVKIEAFDRFGKPMTIESEDFLSIVMQHEIDHLHGIIFIDRVGNTQFDFYKKKWRANNGAVKFFFK